MNDPACVPPEECAPGFARDPLGTCYRFRTLCASAGRRVEHTATTLPDGRVAIIGGAAERTEDYPASIDLFDPRDETISHAGALRHPRGAHVSQLLADGTVLIAGGYFGTEVRAESEVFDPLLGSLAEGPALSTARYRLGSAALANGRALIIGGIRVDPADRSSSLSSECDLYDARSRAAFQRASSLLVPRTVFATATLPNDGRVIVSGGLAEGGQPPPRALWLEVYDPRTDQWTSGCSACTVRVFHSETVLADGRVLFAGGSAVDNGPELASTEIWDPVSGSVQPTGDLNVARLGHSATLLENGRVLITGGAAKRKVLRSAEIYDPQSGVWSMLPTALEVPRNVPTATRLGNGSVLIVGGSSIEQQAAGVQVIEVYESGSVASQCAPDAGSSCASPLNRAVHLGGWQSISVPDAPALRPSDLTVEAWVSFEALVGNYLQIAGKTFGHGTADSFALAIAGDRLFGGVNLTTPEDGAGIAFDPTFGAWYHIALTYDHASNMQTLFLGGAMVASKSANGPPEYDEHPVLFGADYEDEVLQGFVAGIIDEVRIWDVVRSPSEIAGDMHSCTIGQASPVGYWTFDEGTGQTSRDVTGHGHDAQLLEDPDWVSSGVPY